MLPPSDYERKVGWTCCSDSTFCQITLDCCLGSYNTMLSAIEFASIEPKLDIININVQNISLYTC